VQRDAIRRFAEQMLARPSGPAAAPPAAGELAVTLLAMGELTARLHARQRRARKRVAGRFAEFARAGTLRTLGIGPRSART
jgi:hypothetical protein